MDARGRRRGRGRTHGGRRHPAQESRGAAGAPGLRSPRVRRQRVDQGRGHRGAVRGVTAGDRPGPFVYRLHPARIEKLRLPP
ncbi:hypothetical protein Ae168Ps1_2278c [Pseudonocardia sp. Ae168_Ps1]|nr:hypothetical protein Ae150APs1_2271c [Pseudonocardia sp. Ae150A_Ps1]OLL79872.1 hypothetical protein Ae168Ps1_2278c [Pseudonocardia sp. Ae168_Ps1]OLL85995.1 hypothetical protein Ae263Ps1_3050 [Pseudonocardia sp. Ae263_Ps1]OLL93974.1 hypothetical protein Ae356Ps1_3871c [Pseudonocardia sp. Ae356_Ps1]